MTKNYRISGESFKKVILAVGIMDLMIAIITRAYGA